jgi:hypothetical protein
MIENLIWDSEFFDCKIGRIVIGDEMNFDPIKFKEQAIEENYELVYVFKYSEMLTWQKVIRADLEMADIMLTMSKKFDKNEYMDLSYNFRTELNEKELHECYCIAEQISSVSRFHKENKIGPEKTQALYRKWIDNAINKSFSDGLFLEKDLNTITGIHLLKTDEENKIGYFTLTGVNSDFKRIGIGHKLWKQSFAYWANETKIEIIRSPFSFQNSESLNFHLKMGFNKVEEIKYIYHYRNNIS